jgi:hypothetical protein
MPLKFDNKASTAKRPKVKCCHDQTIRGVFRLNEPSADMKVSRNTKQLNFNKPVWNGCECRLNPTVFYSPGCGCACSGRSIRLESVGML